MEIACEDEDDSYANAYFIDDDADRSDDAELADVLAKVQSIQLIEKHLQTSENSVPAIKTELVVDPANTEEKSSTRPASRVSNFKRLQTLSPTSSATTVSNVTKSQDGITTVSRNAQSAKLKPVKKSAIYEEKLLRAATTMKLIEKLRKEVVASSPATIRVRVDTFSTLMLLLHGICYYLFCRSELTFFRFR